MDFALALETIIEKNNDFMSKSEKKKMLALETFAWEHNDWDERDEYQLEMFYKYFEKDNDSEYKDMYKLSKM